MNDLLHKTATPKSKQKQKSNCKSWLSTVVTLVSEAVIVAFTGEICVLKTDSAAAKPDPGEIIALYYIEIYS